MAKHDETNMQIKTPQVGESSTSTIIPIEAYFHQIQQCRKTNTLIESYELWEFHGFLESRVSHMHSNANFERKSSR